MLLLINCRKDNMEDRTAIDTALGTMSMKINGTTWNGQITSINKEEIGYLAQTHKYISGVKIPWEGFGMGNFIKVLGTFRIEGYDTNSVFNPSLSKTASFGTSQDDGDVGCDLFKVIESDSLNNWVNIWQEKDDFKEVWGTFQVSLYRVAGCASSPYPDTLRLTDGQFHLKR